MTETMVPEGPTPGSSRRRLADGARAVWRAAIADKVASGRLRNLDWPHGLDAVTAAALLMCGVAALLALLSGPLRAGSELLVPNSLTSSTPVGVVWLVTFLLVFALAVFALAALHGPWWLKILGFGVSAVMLGLWGVTGTSQAGPLAPVLAGSLVLILLVFWILRGRRPFAWWEFPVLLGLFGLGLGVAVATMSRNAETLGFQFTPLMLDQTASVLTFLVLPAALVAGVRRRRDHGRSYGRRGSAGAAPVPATVAVRPAGVARDPAVDPDRRAARRARPGAGGLAGPRARPGHRGCVRAPHLGAGQDRPLDQGSGGRRSCPITSPGSASRSGWP